MRLFTGIPLCPDVIHHLSRLLDHLRPTAHIKWSPVYNLHITTKFIGEWPEEKVEEVVGALRQMPAQKPIDITVKGLGWLPNPHSPRILFATVREPKPLADLANATEQQLQTLGIAAETKTYFPHITLGRIKEPNPLSDLKHAIAKLPSVEFGNFTADRVHLFRSSRGPSGSVYTHLADFLLTEK
jgi:2'-5' RNA ligase